jgi:hypothetical protein
MATDRAEVLEAIGRMRRSWADPRYSKRIEAVDLTLQQGNRYTREAVNFAIDHLMDSLRPEALIGWAGDNEAHGQRTVGVLNAANIPLVGVQDLIACLLFGYRYLGTLSIRSPFLLSAILADIRTYSDVNAGFDDLNRIFASADAIVGSGTPETLAFLGQQCDEAGIAENARLFRRPSFSVAVLDGSEDTNELSRLAEDCIVHEGLGCRNVAIVFAPSRLSPDGLLQALVRARTFFPPHQSTPGSLEMSRAFLKATAVPHASGDGFLVSKGPPLAQQPCHIRWTEYGDAAEVFDWIQAHDNDIQLVVTSSRESTKREPWSNRVDFGTTQRPEIDWKPDGVDTMAFLHKL